MRGDATTEDSSIFSFTVGTVLFSYCLLRLVITLMSFVKEAVVFLQSRAFVALASIIALATPTLSDGIPQPVRSAAIEISNSCNASSSNTMNSILSVYGIANSGMLYVIDGSQTPCQDGSSLCGTGGCPLVVFRSTGEGTKRIFDQNVFSWQVTSDGSKLNATLHATNCGGRSKASYCDLTLNTKTGKKRITKGQ